MLEALGKTDVGRRRKLNEDNFLVDSEAQLYSVCDGMGGHNAGEVASKIAIESLHSFIEKSHREKEITWPYGLDANLSFAGNRLKTAIKLSNRKVFRTADNREDYSGMGTTVVAALFTPEERMLTVGSAGDSRCYLFRAGELRQLTRDDSWVSAAWAEGILSADEIERHPLKNVITKAVGAKESIELDVVEERLQNGDLVLICSDGLHSMINDEAIRAVLQGYVGQLEPIVDGLIAAANEAGGRDNVSVVLLRYTD
jgi:serine/threonine protein phosphatase PrpC